MGKFIIEWITKSLIVFGFIAVGLLMFTVIVVAVYGFINIIETKSKQCNIDENDHSSSSD